MLQYISLFWHRGRSFCHEECPRVTIKTGDAPCDRGTLFKTEGTSPKCAKTEGTSPKCAVGEFSYMAYDNLGSEAGKWNQLSDKLPNLKGDISYEQEVFYDCGMQSLLWKRVYEKGHEGETG